MPETPELHCFGSNCDPVRVYDTQQAAASHEGTVHGGAQTVFAVVPRADGLGWAMAEVASRSGE